MCKQAYADVYIFHPACEMAVANGTLSFQPNKRIQQFASDLQTLPVYLMNSRDFLLVEPNHVPLARDFFKEWIPAEQIISLNDLTQKADKETVRLNALRPWGWSPVLHKQLEPLKPYLSSKFRNGTDGKWLPDYKPFFSRLYALTLLKELVNIFPKSYFISPEQFAVACKTVDHVKALLWQWNKIVMKAPFSASGRGIQVVSADQWRPFHEQWGGGIIKRQGLLMVEPYFNGKIDIAFQYHVSDSGKIGYLGVTFFKTDARGQYIGNYLGLAHDSDRLKKMVGFSEQQLVGVAEHILLLLEKSGVSQFHRGYLGVDALVYEDKNKLKRLYPVMEINLRSTMGTLAMALERKYLSSLQTGFMGIHFNPEESFASYYSRRKDEISFRALTPIAESTQFGAWMQIENA
jgi:hypothetical protein